MENEKRLIDANLLLECLNVLEASGGHWLYKKACDDMIQGLFPKIVNEQPTVDAVEVVRCKDCKHYHTHNRSSKWNTEAMYCCKSAIKKVCPDDFCSYGERREGE